MFSIPALIKILVIFSLVVIATAKHVHLGLAAAIGGIVIALWQGLTPAAVAVAAVRELLNPDLILLVVLLAAIMAFSAAMKKSGAMDTFANAIAEAAPSRRVALAITPLLIGTLPMPGGAIISAPLVGAMNDDDSRSPETLSAINYWFRHILELIWPLYPAFILTAGLTKLPITTLMVLNLYAPITLFTLGLIFILPRGRESTAHPRLEQDSAPRKLEKTKLHRLVRGIAPLGIVLGSYIVLDVIWELAAPHLGLDATTKSLVGRYAPVLCGIVIGSLYLVKIAGGPQIFKKSITKSTLGLIAVVIGIRIFSALMNAADLAHAASIELASAGIPSIIVIALLPFISGIVTGVGLGYVGLSMPIVLGLISSSGIPFKAGVVIAGAFGYAGMMFSPLHVCMVVTVQHFKATLPSTIRKFALPLGIFVAIASVYGAILMTVMK
ncbi:MAG: DUF401 family protein [Rectinema sp.]|jgi:hypothetical protein|uniref:DUF401 family protein n=1 Tax=uncultured spirochete TaxID=156406 RepID=A0A3P3XRX8_9SPIR|nr:conserved membrane hypothetical protein [uncultured spirochete]